ncbi:MAG: hypothetical protein SPI28_01230 [Acetatifactor sp.]|nr:hypothetical protein [Acetatifactor sp.]
MKVKNSNVLRAISIGLSTVIAMTPMSAMAGEADEAEPKVLPLEGETAPELADKVDAVAENIESVQEKAETAETAEKNVIDAVGQIEMTEDSLDEETAVQDAAEELETAAKNEEGANIAVKEINKVEDDLSDVTDAAEAVDKKFEDASGALEDAEDAANKAQGIVEDAKSEYEEQMEALEGAETIEDADKAYEDAKDTVEKAEKDLDQLKGDYEDAKEAYDTAVEEAKEAQKQYDAAVEQAAKDAEAAQKNLEEVQEKADALESAAKDAKDAYDKISEEVTKESDDAKKALDEADAALEEAKKEAEDAQTAYDDTVEAGKQAIADAEKDLDDKTKAETDAKDALDGIETADEDALKILKLESEMTSNNWDKGDELFQAIMNDYYLKNLEELEGKTFELDKKFTKFNGNEDLNYCKLVVTNADGSQEEIYYNYKLDKDKKNLIIFEKVEKEVVEVEGRDEQYVVEGTDTSLSVEEFEEKKDAYEIVEKVDAEGNASGEFYLKNGDGTEDVQVEEKENTETGESTSIDNTEETYSVTEDGKIVKTVTGDVTEISFVNTELEGGEDYVSYEAAKDAAEAELSDGDKNLDVTVTADGSAEASVTYITTFTTTIDLTGATTEVNGRLSEKDGKEKAIQNIVDIAKDTVVSSGSWVLIGDVGVNNINIERTVDKWSKDTYRINSGSLLLTYAKVSSAEIDLSIFDSKKAKEQAKQKFLSEHPGSVYEDMTAWDWQYKKGTIKYLAGNTVTGQAEMSDQEVTGNVQDILKQEAKDNAMSLAQQAADRKITDTNSIVKELKKELLGNSSKNAITTVANVVTDKNNTAAQASVTSTDVSYSYEGTYDKKNVETKNGEVISTTTWDADLLTHLDAIEEVRKTIYTNENYDNYVKNGDESGILVFEKKGDLRNWLDEAKALEESRAAAQKALEQAKQNTQDAQKAYDDAKAKDVADVADKKAALETAKAAEKAAQDKLDEANDAMTKVNEKQADVTAKANAYEELLAKAQTAKQAVDAAKAEVDTLREKIDALKGQANRDNDLVMWNAQLRAAEDKLEKAQKDFDDLKGELEDAEEKYQEVIDELTPDVPDVPGGNEGEEDPDNTPDDSDNEGEGDSNNTPDDGDNEGEGDPDNTPDDGDNEDEDDQAVTTPVVPENLNNQAPTNPVNTITPTPDDAANQADAQAQQPADTDNAVDGADADNAVDGADAADDDAAADADGDVVEIEDGDTPLADQPVVDGADAEDAEEETGIVVDIEDDKTALADLPSVKEEKTKMPWIWAIIVGLFGAAGYEAYRRHEKKKEIR